MTEYHNTNGSVGLNPPTRSSIAKLAGGYAAKGIPVFPLRGKEPLTRNGFKDASADRSRVTAMFNSARDTTGFGIPTGSFSGLVVVDRDGDSDETRRIWDSLPPTLEVATGRGTHRYYRVPLGTTVRSRKLAPDVDLKADGGYVVAAGSLHPSGIRYEFSSRNEIAELPAHLSARTENPTLNSEEGSGKNNPPTSWGVFEDESRAPSATRSGGAGRRRKCSRLWSLLSAGGGLRRGGV